MMRTPRIAMYGSLNDGYARRIARGMAMVCTGYGVRRRLVSAPPAMLPRLVQEFGLAGLIATVGDVGTAALMRDLPVPVVNVSGRLQTDDLPTTTADNVAVGRSAGEHLVQRSSGTYLVIGIGQARFADEREAGFREVVAQTNGQVFSASAFPTPAALIGWLRAAPKPVGVFGVNDHVAARFMNEAQEGGLRVPEDLRIVGADNDDLVCQMCDPLLTSVDCCFELVGATATRQLLDWIKTGERPPARTLIAPSGLLVRQSSDHVTTADDLVNKAMAMIRSEAASGLTVKKLVQRLGLSRRALELRFHRELKTTPAAEMQRVQIEAACRMLVDTDVPLSRVVEASGFSSQRQLRSVFHRALGASPMRFRARFRPLA